jgi:hypothetical protein
MVENEAPVRLWNAVGERLEKTQRKTPEGWGETGKLVTDPADSPDVRGHPLGRLKGGAVFFTPNGRNSLKRLIPKNKR